MAYIKVIEIHCNYCGQAYHCVTSNLRLANEDYKKVGGIVKSDGSHYCDTKCYEKGYFNDES